MEYENKYASNSKGNAALTTGIIGTAGVGLGLLGNLLGGNGWGGNCAPVCSENMPVTRYDQAQAAKISALESSLALRDANIYGDQKSLELYRYIDGQLREIRDTLCAQAVTNQKTADSFALASADLTAARRELHDQIKLEAERRCCSDNAIVNYVNATFYPKSVADVTVGTTTTAQTLYNPIPDCGCCGK